MSFFIDQSFIIHSYAMATLMKQVHDIQAQYGVLTQSPCNSISLLNHCYVSTAFALSLVTIHHHKNTSKWYFKHASFHATEAPQWYFKHASFHAKEASQVPLMHV